MVIDRGVSLEQYGESNSVTAKQKEAWPGGNGKESKSYSRMPRLPQLESILNMRYGLWISQA